MTDNRQKTTGMNILRAVDIIIGFVLLSVGSFLFIQDIESVLLSARNAGIMGLGASLLYLAYRWEEEE